MPRVLDQKIIQLERPDFEHIEPREPIAKKYIVPKDHIGVATLVKNVAIKLHRFTKEDAMDEDMPLRIFIGMGWEYICAAFPNNKDILWQPGHFSKQLIVGHPDGLKPMGDRHKLVEFKYTWKSIRAKGGKDTDYKSILDEFMWLHQVMGYINLLNKAYEFEIDQAEFHICWGRGNYEWFAKEIYAQYTVQFDEDDLNGNWIMLTRERLELQDATVPF